MQEKARRRHVPWIFIGPFLFFFVIFLAFPTLYSVAISFMKYKAGRFSFMGLKNFQFLLTDPTFGKAIWNTFIILGIQVPVQMLLAVIVANFLNSTRLRMKGLFRMFSFMPVLLDTVSYSIVFLLFFNNNPDAFVNGVLRLVGMGPFAWLNNGMLAKIVIIAAVTWRWTGYNTIILLGGLQNISADLYEAASIDGASKLRRFLSITLPGVKPVLIFCIILSVNGILQLFTETNLITKGGPTNETLTIVQYLYNVGFGAFNYGVAAAGSYILAIMIGLMTFFQMKLTREE